MRVEWNEEGLTLRVLELALPEGCTLLALQRLVEEHTGVPPESQVLRSTSGAMLWLRREAPLSSELRKDGLIMNEAMLPTPAEVAAAAAAEAEAEAETEAEGRAAPAAPPTATPTWMSEALPPAPPPPPPLSPPPRLPMPRQPTPSAALPPTPHPAPPAAAAGASSNIGSSSNSNSSSKPRAKPASRGGFASFVQSVEMETARAVASLSWEERVRATRSTRKVVREPVCP